MNLDAEIVASVNSAVNAFLAEPGESTFRPLTRIFNKLSPEQKAAVEAHVAEAGEEWSRRLDPLSLIKRDEELLSVQDEDLEFVLPGLPVGEIHITAAPGGTGKSLITMEAAAFVASTDSDNCGRNKDKHDLLGLYRANTPLVHGNVLMICAEERELILRRRLRKIYHAAGIELENEWRPDDLLAQMNRPRHFNRKFHVDFMSASDLLRLETEHDIYPDIIEPLDKRSPFDIRRSQPTKFAELLKRAIAERDYKLMALDPLGELHSSDENSSTEMRMLIRKARWVKGDTCAMSISHHTTKDADHQAASQAHVRGSTSLVDGARCVWVISRPANDPRDEYRLITVPKRNYARVEPMWLRFDSENIVFRACDPPTLEEGEKGNGGRRKTKSSRNTPRGNTVEGREGNKTEDVQNDDDFDAVN